MAQRVLEDLSPEECYALLEEARVGRLVFVDDLGPVAVPVNFAMAGTDIVVRAEGGTKKQAMQQPSVSFEVDHIDDASASGWSVLVRGSGSEVDLGGLPPLLKRMAGGFPAPWAFGVHNVWLKITPTTVTGRRLAEQRVAEAY